MNKRIKHDDGNLIWFDFKNIDLDALENMDISKFDMTNMPVVYEGRDILGYPRYSPVHFELKNYYVCFFEDAESETKYSCMCINKNKEIYKQNIGYDKCGIPLLDEY